MNTRIKYLMVLLLITLTPLMALAQDDEATKQHLIEIVEATETFTGWLPNYPNYQANAYGPDENGIWYVEFYNEAGDEWLGYANIDADTDEIQDSFAPIPLAADVYQTQLERVNGFVLADPEVRAWLDNNPDLWDMYPDYNRWDAAWDVYFYRGIKGVRVRLNVDANTGNIYLDSIIDPNQLNEEEALENARNTAINLAYEVEGVWDALNGYDNWSSYTEQQGGSLWTVSFAAGGQELFYALVDVDAEKVLESHAGG